MKREKKAKGYWEELSEHFETVEQAKRRAGFLRNNENISHVTVEKEGDGYTVHFSIASWYLEELRRAGMKI